MQTLAPPPARSSALTRLFNRVYAKQVDGIGLAVFRVVFCAVLLVEVGQLFYFRHLIFDIVPFVEVAEIGFTTPLLLWMATLVLLMLGLWTRPAAAVNYGFCLVFFSSLKTYAYMMTPVYIGMSLLFLFLPIGRCLSLDRLRQQLRRAVAGQPPAPRATVSQLAYYAPVVVGLAFVYLDSALYKLTSPLWLAGLGMWQTLSLPYEVQVNASWLLNQEWLVKTLGYLTLAFEFLFIFLFPFRKYRLGLLVIGVGLHLGILLTLAVPLFTLGFGSLYVLLVPAGRWRRGFERLVRPRQRLAQLYAAADGRAHWLVMWLAGAARPTPAPPIRPWSRRAAGVGLLGLAALQGVVSYNAPLPQLLQRKSGLAATQLGQGLTRAATLVEGPARNYLGITNHPISLDEHFAGYTRLVAVTYTGADGVERFLPITRPNGQPGGYLFGSIWLKWTYGLLSRKINQPKLEKGLRSFTAFWAHQHGVDLANCRFRVKVKKIAEPTGWQPDFLNQQLAADWREAGFVTWHDQEFIAHLADIPAM